MANSVDFSLNLFVSAYERLDSNSDEGEVVKAILAEHRFRKSFDGFRKQVQQAVQNAVFAKREAAKPNSSFARYINQAQDLPANQIGKLWKEFQKSQCVDSESIMKRWTAHLQSARGTLPRRRLSPEQSVRVQASEPDSAQSTVVQIPQSAEPSVQAFQVPATPSAHIEVPRAAKAWTLEDYARLVKRQDIELIKDQLLPFQIPDIDRAAALLYAHRVAAKKTGEERFIPASAVIPWNVYVSSNGKIFFQGTKIADCSATSGGVFECVELESQEPLVVKDIVACHPENLFYELDVTKSLQGGLGILPLISYFCYPVYPSESVFRIALVAPKYEASIDQVKDQLSVKQKQAVAIRMVQILGELSKKGVHRDIGLKNFLIRLDPFDVRVFDFETFWFYGSGEGNQDRAGTCENFSPEYAKAKGLIQTAEATTSKLDVWAMGTSLLELFTGFKRVGENRIGLLSQISQLEPGWTSTVPGWDSVPPAWQSLIAQMTEIDPEKRISAKEAAEQVEKMLAEDPLSD